jgi:C1A family cysteine protease
MRRTAHDPIVAMTAFVWALALASGASSDPPAEERSAVPAPAPAQASGAVAVPASVDLRETFASMGLPPRPQGARGTCSIFTTCAAIEFALAKLRGKAERLSPEYLNWAASQALGRPSDGNFFHNALAGFERHGICGEAAMPYAAQYDAARAPSSDATKDAHAIRAEAKTALQVHWIMRWERDRSGVDDAGFAEIKAALARGYPVAAGSGHSRLLVGYRDDASKPGGGVFVTLDSALDRFDEVTYEFVRKDVADVFWIEAKPPKAPASEPAPKGA